MREDQIKRLEDVSQRLAEVAIRDADPETWTASEVPLVDMTRDERGDANWCRKTAVQTLAVLAHVQRILTASPAPGAPGAGSEVEASPEDQIARAERAANEMLERIGKKGVAAR